jgi:hypothetical protein
MLDSKDTGARSSNAIPTIALVRDENSSVACSLRDVAREAARQWGQAQLQNTPGTDPEDFGKAIARVYLSALAGINAGFEPGTERPGGHA